LTEILDIKEAHTSLELLVLSSTTAASLSSDDKATTKALATLDLRLVVRILE
jgi:hypothetical protein